MALWNRYDLQRPTTLTCKVFSQEIDVKSLTTKIDDIIKFLENQETLHFEAALLGRLIYRMRWKFRSDKGLKNMQKTNRGLLNYLKLSVAEDFKYLRECVEINADSNYVVLPSKQLIEYNLVRIQSFAKLMARIESVSHQAGYFLHARISIGQAWDVALISYSVISRIWILSRHLTKKYCDWYKTLYECRDTLKTTGVEWLPKDYDLPFDLKCWLDLPWMDKVLPSISTDKELKKDIFNLIKHADDDSENELNFEIEDIPITPKTSLSTKQFDAIEGTSISKSEKQESREQKTFSFGVADVGEPISRDAFDSILKKQFKEKKIKKHSQDGESNKNKHKSKIRKKVVQARKELKYENNEACLDKKRPNLTPDDLKTESDVILFLKSKSYPGMNKLQWKMLKKNVRQFLVDVNESNESISRKKKLRMVIKKIRESTS